MKTWPIGGGRIAVLFDRGEPGFSAPWKRPPAARYFMPGAREVARQFTVRPRSNPRAVLELK